MDLTDLSDLSDADLLAMTAPLAPENGLHTLACSVCGEPVEVKTTTHKARCKRCAAEGKEPIRPAAGGVPRGRVVGLTRRGGR